MNPSPAIPNGRAAGPLRVAIVGCGKIADQHLLAIRRLSDCAVVALCDHEILMARQLGERFGVTACFADAGELLAAVRPDVVHLTTPPQAHFAVARQCLLAGCHVYVEKPFTLNTADARALFELAAARGRQLTAGHNYQFTPEMLAMRRLVAANYLGGAPVHLESHWPYDLTDVSYVAPILASPTHWVRQLPGQLYHNLISHGLSKLVEFLEDDLVEIRAFSHQSERLRQLGGGRVQDELRVFLRDARGTTAYFTFSTQIKPGLNVLRLYGPRRALIVDHNSGSLLRQETTTAKSYLTFVLPPLVNAREQLRNAWTNLKDIYSGRRHQDSGMKELIGQFYQSITHGAPPPIPPREILLTTRIMEEVFNQVYPPAVLAGPSR